MAFDPAMALRGKELPSLLDIKYTGSFILGNSHPPLSLSLSLSKNYKEIGGYHIDPHIKPMPQVSVNYLVIKVT